MMAGEDVRRRQRRVVVGVDIGQKHDPTAIAVAEYLKRPRVDVPGRDEWYYPTRHLERLPLGTDYGVVATRIVEVVANIKERAHARMSSHLGSRSSWMPPGSERPWLTSFKSH